jgi:hypothetical protein
MVLGKARKFTIKSITTCCTVMRLTTQTAKYGKLIPTENKNLHVAG